MLDRYSLSHRNTCGFLQNTKKIVVDLFKNVPINIKQP